MMDVFMSNKIYVLYIMNKLKLSLQSEGSLHTIPFHDSGLEYSSPEEGPFYIILKAPALVVS